LDCAFECDNEGWGDQFRMDAKRGFLYLSTTIKEGTKKLLMLTPRKIPQGTTIYQEWMPMFNLELLQGLKILMWCSLKMFPFEYRPFGEKIVA
jgi:hypothetical protein